MKKIKFLPEYLHYVYSFLLKNSNKVLDMGGNGRLKRYFKGDIVTANIRSGLDACNTMFPDKSFDACISGAVLEHVIPENQLKFIKESIRLSSYIVHWFPYGEHAKKTEDFKIDYVTHLCNLPNEKIIEYIKENYKSVEIKPFITVGEHLMFLGSIYPKLNTQAVYKFLYENYDKPYGILLYGIV